MTSIQNERPTPQPRAGPRRARAYNLAVTVLLVAGVAYFYGDCLRFGPVLDDHWHQKGLRDDPWTLAGLEHTGTIDIANLLDCWWQEKPVRWRYPRPLFIAIMKAVYRGCGNDPVGLHALSLLLHTLSAILIWRLALWLTGLRFWSVVATLIFAVYQHVVIPVSWPSALNTVIVTFMMLAAMMLYLRRLSGEARRAKSEERNPWGTAAPGCPEGQSPATGTATRSVGPPPAPLAVNGQQGPPRDRIGSRRAQVVLDPCPTPRRAGTPDATGATEGGQPPTAGCTANVEGQLAPARRARRPDATGRQASPAPPSCLRAFVPLCLAFIPSSLRRCVASSLRRAAITLTILLLFAAGLLVRENMLMLPVLLLAIEATFAGVRSVRRNLGFYAFFAATGGVFLIWRIVAYGGGMPEVYLRRPHGEWGEYGIWLVAKLLHYLSVSIWPGPMVVGPTGRYNPLLERPGDFALMLVLVGGAAWIYHRCTRGLAGRWIWPLWLLLAVLPVVPVIATPHSGYLVAAPIAMCVLAMVAGTNGGRVPQVVASGLRARRPHSAEGSVGHGGPTLQKKRESHLCGGRRYATRAAALGYLGLMGLFTILHSWEWKGIVANDRYLVEQVCVDPPTPGVTDVYFINLPFANVYARWALVERLGRWFEQVRVHVLTFAPHPLLVESHTTVTQLDDRTIRVQIEGQPYFSRLLGRFLIEAFRTSGPFRNGQIIRGGPFDVRILDADSSGVRALEFRFRKPLADPTQAFYLASRESIATRLHFEKSEERSQKSEMVASRPGLARPSVASDLRVRRSAGQRRPTLQHRGQPKPVVTAAGRPRLAESMAASHPRLADPDVLTGRLLAGDPNAAEPLFARLAEAAAGAGGHPRAAGPHWGDTDRLREAREALALVGCVISECTGAEVQPLFDCPQAWSAGDIDRLRRWWRRRVGWREMQDIWLRRNDFQALIEWRDEVPHAIWWAAHAVHSDLYLTGPPFDGPRPPRP